MPNWDEFEPDSSGATGVKWDDFEIADTPESRPSQPAPYSDLMRPPEWAGVATPAERIANRALREQDDPFNWPLVEAHPSGGRFLGFSGEDPEKAAEVQRIKREGLPEEKIALGLREGADEFLSGLTTPTSLATLGVAGALRGAPAIGRALSAYFAYKMGKQLTDDTAKQLGEEYAKPPHQRDTHKLSKLWTSAAFTAPMTAELGAHTLAGSPIISPPSPEQILSGELKSAQPEMVDPDVAARNRLAPGTVGPNEIQRIGPMPEPEAPEMFQLGEMPFEHAPRFGATKFPPPVFLPERVREPMLERGGQTYREAGEKIPGFEKTAEDKLIQRQEPIRENEALWDKALQEATDNGKAVGLNKSTEAAAVQAVEKGNNASRIEEAAGENGNLPTPSEQGAGAVPVEQGSEGVRGNAPAEPAGSGAEPAHAKAPEVSLIRYVADVASGKIKTTEEAMRFGKTVKTADDIARLKAAAAELTDEGRAALKALPEDATVEQLQEASNAASRAQFINEAIETATGASEVKGKDPEKFRALMEAGQPAARPLDVKQSSGQAPRVERLLIKPRTDGLVTLEDTGGFRIGTFKTADEAGKAATDLGYTIAPGSPLKPTPAETSAPQGETKPAETGTEPGKFETGAKAAADKLREWLKTEGDTLGTFGPVPRLINAAVEIAARIIEGGGKLADALDAAVKHIRLNHSGAFDEPGLRKQIADVIGKEFPEHASAGTGTPVAGAAPAKAAPSKVAPPALKPGDKTAIAELTDYLAKNKIESPDLPLGERLSKWIDLAGAWARGKDAFTRGLAGARATSAGLLDSYLHLPKWDGFEAARGKWSGADNRSGQEVLKFRQVINKAVPDPARQEAITNWIQADGNEATLRSRADATTDPKLKKGYELALDLTPGELSLAEEIRGYLDQRLQEGINAGILRQGVDNYVTQIWKQEPPTTAKLRGDLFGTGNLNPSFRYARQRVFGSYFEGEQAGFAPRDKRIGTLVSAYELAFNRAVSSRAFIKSLHEANAADGMPIAMTSGRTMPVGTPGEIPEAFLIKPRQAPQGAVTEDGRPYRVVDHWALRDWKWATNGPDGQPVIVQGDMLVHPDYYRELKNMLGTSALSRNEGITKYTTRPLLQGSAFLKQTKLSLSAFHLTQEALHGLFHRVNPGNLVELDFANQAQRELADHGLQVADPRAAQLFGEGLAGGGLIAKVPLLGKIQVGFNDWLFKEYIPRLKMTMALHALERNRAAYAKELESGKVTDDQIQALTAREANAAFGELNYRMMGRNPTVQDLLRLTVLAPDFLEARSRFVAQALKPYGREQQVALGLMGATMFITARILNKWLDDDPHWDHPFSVIHKGKEYRLRTVLGDVQHLVQDPRMFAYNRLSPGGRATTETLTSRDERGIKRTGWEQIKDVAAWLLPIPTQKKSDTTTGQQILSSTGVGVRNYGPVQQVYELADKWKKDNTDPRIKEQYEAYQRETHPDSPYKQIRDAILKGDEKAAREAAKKLLETRTPAQIRQGMSPRPFTGNAANERKFLQSLDPHQREIYRQAVEERKRVEQEALRLLR